MTDPEDTRLKLLFIVGDDNDRELQALSVIDQILGHDPHDRFNFDVATRRRIIAYVSSRYGHD